LTATAAHCVTNFANGSLDPVDWVDFNRHDLRNHKPGAVCMSLGAAHQIRHPGFNYLTGTQLVVDISANSPHHFLVFCHIFANFWRKIKVDSVLESGESHVSI
jgi:hypothetical protein